MREEEISEGERGGVGGGRGISRQRSEMDEEGGGDAVAHRRVVR